MTSGSLEALGSHKTFKCPLFQGSCSAASAQVSSLKNEPFPSTLTTLPATASASPSFHSRCQQVEPQTPQPSSSLGLKLPLSKNEMTQLLGPVVSSRSLKTPPSCDFLTLHCPGTLPPSYSW